MANKELEIIGCKTFVCPNLGLIEQRGIELNLRDETIERARDMASEYFKKTYHMPTYGSPKSLLPSFLYLAGIIENNRISQKELARVFGIALPTIGKWTRRINDIADLKVIF